MLHELDYATPNGRNRPALRTVNFISTAIAMIVYAWTFGRLGGVGAIAFFFPFTMLPFVINALVAAWARTMLAHLLLLFIALGYAAWFAYVFVDVTYLHPDPQSPIAFLFVGIFASPALVILWLFIWYLERRGGSRT